ncbi:MAG: lysophospholipid acyltransferase family protein [Aliihoeflea sp.]
MIAIRRQRLFPELTYANDGHRRLQRFLIESIENLSGRERLAALYDIWRRDVAPGGLDLFSAMLRMVGIELRIDGVWPPPRLPDTPLVMVANHPFGIADGIAMLSLAERLGRPFRVMIHKDLLRISEMTSYALPIDFSETREAVAANLAVRNEALRLLRDGVTIVVFPAGGVATAQSVIGKASDLEWKMFPARLVRDAGASVIPLHFAGQNSRWFHLASRFSMTLRTAMLIPEFTRRTGRPMDVRVGPVIHADAFGSDRKAVLQRMYRAVFDLADEECEEPASAVCGGIPAL